MRKPVCFFFDRVPEPDFLLMGNEQYSRDRSSEKIAPARVLFPTKNEDSLLRWQDWLA